MTETKASGAKIPTFGPEAQRRLRHATYCAAAIIFVMPMIRSGMAELSLTLIATAFGEGPLRGLVYLAVDSLISLIPLAIFLLWSWPDFDRIGLPPRSKLLLALLLAYLPVQVIFQPHYYSDSSLELVHEVNEAVPAIWVIRHLDKPTLVLLAVWALWRGRTMGPGERLAFHFLLFLCLIWALCAWIDAGFGASIIGQ